MFRARGSAVFFVSYTRRTHRVRRISLLHPESVIRIKSVFLLYIEHILVVFLAGRAGHIKKNRTKRGQWKTKKRLKA